MFTQKVFIQQIFTKNFHTKFFSHKQIFHWICRLSFVDLRWAQLYVSLVYEGFTNPQINWSKKQKLPIIPSRLFDMNNGINSVNLTQILGILAAPTKLS